MPQGGGGGCPPLAYCDCACGTTKTPKLELIADLPPERRAGKQKFDHRVNAKSWMINCCCCWRIETRSAMPQDGGGGCPHPAYCNCACWNTCGTTKTPKLELIADSPPERRGMTRGRVVSRKGWKAVQARGLGLGLGLGWKPMETYAQCQSGRHGYALAFPSEMENEKKCRMRKRKNSLCCCHSCVILQSAAFWCFLILKIWN